jgi:hypothetical protein
MDDYLAWRKRDQPLLHNAVLREARATRDGGRKDSTIQVDEISQAHLNLLPGLKKIFDYFPELREPRDIWIREKCYKVQFSSPIGIPRFMSLRAVGGSWSGDNGFVEARNRFAIAVVGGVSLIVPITVMTLIKNIRTSLIVVSVAVLLFAIVLAAWPVVYDYLPWVRRWKGLGGQDMSSNLGPKEVLLATAAYAAVLVVFLGTSGP